MCKTVITCESVSYAHPDKIADAISDAILDEFLKQDSNAKTGIETLVKDNIVVLGGEVSSTATVNYEEVVRNVFKNLPFSKEHHLAPNEIKIINLIGKQSTEIHNGVDKGKGIIGAGDQGFMVGYASNETYTYMPLGHYLAKKICQYIASLTPLYGPDTKSQVTVEYDENNIPTVKHILISTMHQNSLDNCRNDITRYIINNEVNMSPLVFKKYIKDNNDLVIDINPCGVWRTGGPVSDCGVTGRKIVVDAYGGYCNVGGGAFSGKDLTKVDRSAAYMCRYLAKNIVATGICNTAKVELSYMIGIPEPSAINVELDINNDKADKIIEWIKTHIDLTPKGIIERFDGLYPRYYNTARNGHYGYNVNGNEELEKLYPWEKINFSNSLSLFIKQ